MKRVTVQSSLLAQLWIARAVLTAQGGGPIYHERSIAGSTCRAFGRPHRIRDRYRLHTDRHHPSQQVDHALLVVGEPIGVEQARHGRVLDLLLLVLIEHPVDGGTVAEPVIPRHAQHPGQLRLAVEHDGPGIGQRLQLGKRRAATGHVAPRQVRRLDSLIADVQVEQRLAPVPPLRESVVQRDARQLASQVGGIGLAVHWVVEDRIDVGEDAVLAQVGGFGGIAGAELRQRPVGDVVDSLAGKEVAVAGDHLKTIDRSECMEIRQCV